jgi:hypothetical protein
VGDQKKPMAKVLYEGPRGEINVVPFGKHAIGEEKEYPVDFAEDLVKTSKKNKFKITKSPPKKKGADERLADSKPAKEDK